MRKLLSVVIVCLLLPFQAWAATYYVAESSAGGADGTAYADRASVSYHNAGTGVFGTLDGDTVVLTGTIISKVTPPDSGSAGNYVTYDGDDGVNPAALIDRNGGQYGIESVGKDYLIFQDIEITDFGAVGSGIVGYGGCDYHTIKRCTIHDGDDRGIFYTNTSGGCSHITVGGALGDGNEIYNCGTSSAGGDVELGGSTDIIISYNKLYATGTTRGRDGVVTEWCDRILIEYNKIYDHNYNTTEGENAIDLKSSTNDVIIRFNEMYGHNNPEEGAIQIQMDSDNVAVYGNRIYDNNCGILIFDAAYGFPGNGTSMSDINIWSNLIYKNDMYGISVYPHGGDAVNSVAIFNNLFAENGDNPYQSYHTAIRITTGTGHYVKNNIFYKNRPNETDYIQASYSVSGVTLDYNQYYWPSQTSYVYWSSGNRDIATLQGTYSKETNGDDGDPGITNPGGNVYTLLGTSTCRDDGEDLSGLAASYTIQGTVYDMYWDDGLDDSYVDFSTFPPTVRVIPRDTYGWDRGAFTSYDVGNKAPNGTITSPPSNTTVDEDDSVSLAGSYTDPEDDTCTYAWDIPTNTFKVWAGGTTYATGDLVEDDGVAGAYYKSIQDSNTNHNPPDVTWWVDAETQEIPGTGICDLAGVYTIGLTVSDDAPLADDTPASVTITVNDPGPGGSPTTEIWSQNTVGAYAGDYIQGNVTYIAHQYPTVPRGSEDQVGVILTDGDSWFEAPLSFNLTDISGETVTGARLGLYLHINPSNATTNIELWSLSDAFVEATATWNTYDGSNAWTGTRGHLTFLDEVQFTTSSVESQFYEWESAALTSYIGSVAATGGTAYLTLIDDTIFSGGAWFISDDFTDGQRLYLEIDYGASDPASVPEIVGITCETADGSYNDADSIGDFLVTFNEAVTVTGTPQLKLELGANDAVVNYSSGSGTLTLTFAAFTVASGSSHTSADLDGTQLDLNSGTIVATDDATAVADTADILDVFPTGATIGSLAYNKAIVIDTTVPGTSSVNNTDSHATADDTYSTLGTIIQFAIVFDETSLDINAEPGYPRIAMSVHPIDTVYAYAMGLGDTTGTSMMGFPLTAGMRSADLNFTGDLDLGPGGTITDPSGNPIATSMGALDLSAVAAIVISVPKTDWDLSATGDYATFTAFDTATYSVPDDKFICDYTGNLNTDVSGTSGHEIIFTGTITGQVVIDEDYINLDTLTIN